MLGYLPPRPAPILTLGLLAAVVLAGCAQTGVGSALQRANPFTATYEQVDGKLIEELPRKEWSQPDFKSVDAEDAQPAGAVAVPDGRTLLRLQNPGLVRVPELTAYLNDVADRLLAHSPTTGAPIRVVVVGRRSFDAATATPDGMIGIPVGLLLNLENEDQLAFVLSHEISHVLLEHHDIEWLQRYQGYAVSAAELGLKGLRKVGQRAPELQEAARDVHRYVKLGDLAYQVTRDAFLTSWSRKQEDEADLLGFDLAIAAGYNPSEALAFFNIYEAWLGKARARDSAASSAAAGGGLITQSSKRPEDENRRRDDTSAWDVLLTAAETGLKAVHDQLRKRHRELGERRDDIDNYYVREYIDVVPGAPKETPYRQAMEEVDEFLNAYALAWKATDSLRAGKMPAAKRFSRKAVLGPASRDAVPRLARYRVEAVDHRYDTAAENLRLALEGDDPGLPVYRNLIELHTRTGNYRDALDVAATAREDLGRVAPLYPIMIHLHHRVGEQAKADKLAIECRLYFRPLAEACEEAARGRRGAA